VAPKEVKTTDMYKGVVAFITLQLIGLAVVGAYPPLVNYLPQRTSLLSDTAPPPRNPRLQACIEDYLVARIETGEAEVRDAVAEARRLDLSYLPEDLRESLTESFDSAEQAVQLLIQADAAAGRVDEAAVEFKPLLVQVRGIERDIRAVEAEIDETETTISRLLPQEEDDRPILEARLQELQAELEALQAEIPEEFEARFETFSEIEGEETGLRRDYRRAGDTSARNAMDVMAVIRSTEAFAALEDDLSAMLERIRSGEAPADLVDPITDLRAAVGDVEGARDVRSEVNDARSALRDDEPDVAEAVAAMERALALHAEQMAWRSRAQEDLLPGLEAYLERITETVGVRQRDRMPREMALSVAACESRHRDLSLRF
jgi:chromosome segregation ATPase